MDEARHTAGIRSYSSERRGDGDRQGGAAIEETPRGIVIAIPQAPDGREPDVRLHARRGSTVFGDKYRLAC